MLQTNTKESKKEKSIKKIKKGTRNVLQKFRETIKLNDSIEF